MPIKMRTTMVGDWGKARSILEGGARLKKAIDLAVRQEAHDARKQIVQGIREQAPGGRRFAKLSPLTLAMRKFQGFKGSKALLVTGTLRNSIVVKKAGSGRYFVGVLRTARSKNDSRPVVNVAALHEYGGTVVVRVTPKMRKFLMMVMSRSKGRNKAGRSGKGQLARGVIVIKIPARPYIGPVIEKMGSSPAAVRKRLAQRISRNMKLTLGKV